MRRLTRLLLVGLATLSSTALLPMSAGACGYCTTMADLNVAHPRSIEVALAVRDAMDRGDLAALPSVSRLMEFRRARQVLTDFHAMVPSVAGAQNSSVALLAIESGIWTRYSFTGSEVVGETHVTGPLEGEMVIVTSEAVLRAILDGALSPARAGVLGLLLVIRPA